jgi:hypothetical protein
LTLLGNIGVVAGIVFLGIEMHQNTNAMIAASRQSVVTNAQAELFKVTDDPSLWLFANQVAPLSPEEQVRFSAYLGALARAREYSWLQYRDGSIDEAQWATEYEVTRWVFGTSRAREWWEKSGRVTVSPSYAAFVDAEIVSEPLNRDWWLIESTWSTK